MKDAIQYTVTVTAVVERTQKLERQWVKIGQKPSAADTTKMSDDMGWTPEVEGVVRKDIEIFKQTVDTLDMGQLVRVVNHTERSIAEQLTTASGNAGARGEAISRAIRSAKSRRS